MRSCDLAPGDELEVGSDGPEITLRPVARVVYEHGIPVFDTGQPHTVEDINALIDRIREERDLVNLGMLE